MGWPRTILLGLVVLAAGPLLMVAAGRVSFGKAWYEVDRASAHLAPNPAAAPAAIVQVYAARAFNWRGAFAVHTWIATKKRGAVGYRVYQVTAWRPRPLPAIQQAPDRKWFGHRPVVVAGLRGEPARTAIAQIQAAAAAYPYAGAYRVWPGPNSNTFTAWMIRHVPALKVAMPATAIGKDYLGIAGWARAPSGTGYQACVFGVLGVMLARREGLEIDILGATLAVDPAAAAIALPGIGRIGGDRHQRGQAAGAGHP